MGKQYSITDDADRLDLTRRGKLPDVNRRAGAERPIAVDAWMAQWRYYSAHMSKIMWSKIIELQLLAYIEALEATINNRALSCKTQCLLATGCHDVEEYYRESEDDAR